MIYAAKKALEKRLVILLLACIALIFTSCSKANDSTSLRLKWISYIGWAGEYAALYKGFWEEEGIQIDIRPGGFELDPIRLVPSGTDDFGVTGGDVLLQARARGIPVKAFALQYQTSPAAFMVKSESGIRTPKDFEGRRVGISPGTDKHTVYLAMLEAAGVDRSKISEVPVRFDLTPFFTDDVEVFPVFSTNQPIQARAEGIDVDVIDPMDFGVSYIGNVYFTMESTIRDRPEMVAGFLRGVVKGWEWALSAPEEEVAAMMIEFNPELDVTTQLSIWRAVKPYLLPANGHFGWMTVEQWDNAIDLLHQQGLLVTIPDIQDVFTTTFLDSIYSAGG